MTINGYDQDQDLEMDQYFDQDKGPRPGPGPGLNNELKIGIPVSHSCNVLLFP